MQDRFTVIMQQGFWPVIIMLAAAAMSVPHYTELLGHGYGGIFPGFLLRLAANAYPPLAAVAVVVKAVLGFVLLAAICAVTRHQRPLIYSWWLVLCGSSLVVMAATVVIRFILRPYEMDRQQLIDLPVISACLLILGGIALYLVMLKLFASGFGKLARRLAWGHVIILLVGMLYFAPLNAYYQFDINVIDLDRLTKFNYCFLQFLKWPVPVWLELWEHRLQILVFELSLYFPRVEGFHRYLTLYSTITSWQILLVQFGILFGYVGAVRWAITPWAKPKSQA